MSENQLIPGTLLNVAIKNIFAAGLRYFGPVDNICDGLHEEFPSYLDLFSSRERRTLISLDSYFTKDEWYDLLEAQGYSDNEEDDGEDEEDDDDDDEHPGEIDPRYSAPQRCPRWRLPSGDSRWRKRFLKEHKFSIVAANTGVKKPFSELHPGIIATQIRWLELMCTGLYPLEFVLNGDELAVNEGYQLSEHVAATGKKTEVPAVKGERNRMTSLPILSFMGHVGPGLCIMHGEESDELQTWDFTNKQIPFRGITPAHKPRSDKTIPLYDVNSLTSAGKPALPSIETWASQSDAPPIVSQETSKGDSDPLPQKGNFDDISSYEIDALSTVAPTTEIYPTSVSSHNTSSAGPLSTLHQRSTRGKRRRSAAPVELEHTSPSAPDIGHTRKSTNHTMPASAPRKIAKSSLRKSENRDTPPPTVQGHSRSTRSNPVKCDILDTISPGYVPNRSAREYISANYASSLDLRNGHSRSDSDSDDDFQLDDSDPSFDSEVEPAPKRRRHVPKNSVGPMPISSTPQNYPRTPICVRLAVLSLRRL
jgi:hypothetical protein